MYKDLEEKRLLYRQKRPATPQFSAWEEESALWGWLYSCLRLQGMPLEKGQIVSVMRGEILEDVPLNRYGFLHRYRDVYRDIQSGLGMKPGMSRALLDRYYEMLFGKPPILRSNNPTVYEWSYNPPHFSEIREQMELLMRRHARRSKETDPVTAMTELHLGILEIYPYGDDTVAMAGVALLFELLGNELPAGSLFVSEQEYHGMVADYFASGDASAFRDMLTRSVLNRFDVLIQVSESAGE